MRCIHASHAALVFFLFVCLIVCLSLFLIIIILLLFICLFRSRSHLFTLHSCLRATFRSCFALRRMLTPAFPPSPSSSSPSGEGCVQKGRRRKSKTTPSTTTQKPNKTNGRGSRCRGSRKSAFARPLPPRRSTGGRCSRRGGLCRSGGVAARRRPPRSEHRAQRLQWGTRASARVFYFSHKEAEVQRRS